MGSARNIVQFIKIVIKIVYFNTNGLQSSPNKFIPTFSAKSTAGKQLIFQNWNILDRKRNHVRIIGHQRRASGFYSRSSKFIIKPRFILNEMFNDFDCNESVTNI